MNEKYLRIYQMCLQTNEGNLLPKLKTERSEDQTSTNLKILNFKKLLPINRFFLFTLKGRELRVFIF